MLAYPIDQMMKKNLSNNVIVKKESPHSSSSSNFAVQLVPSASPVSHISFSIIFFLLSRRGGLRLLVDCDVAVGGHIQRANDDECKANRLQVDRARIQPVLLGKQVITSESENVERDRFAQSRNKSADDEGQREDECNLFLFRCGERKQTEDREAVVDNCSDRSCLDLALRKRVKHEYDGRDVKAQSRQVDEHMHREDPAATVAGD